MLLTLLRLITKKNYKSNPLVMKPVGPYRNIKYDSLCSYELVITIFPEKLLTLINKTNDLILNLTPENVTQHSRIE